jgi:2-keto-4-pentenoate hydratase/2-oxohepta-3-ene-1,7-dioic acid hydratase in catechol pathway
VLGFATKDHVAQTRGNIEASPPAKMTPEGALQGESGRHNPGPVEHAEISLDVNGQNRQKSSIEKLMWNISEIIEHLSAAWELQPGDLIFTGTPEGVGAVKSGDLMVGGVGGIGQLRVQIQ